MKKVVLLVVLLSATLVSFAQDKDSFKSDILKLMNAKNGMNSVHNVGNELANKVNPEKKVSFTTSIKTLKSNFINHAINTIKSTYTQEQINSIYTEFLSDEINYTDQTNDFFRLFRKLKGEYFRDVKLLYGKNIL